MLFQKPHFKATANTCHFQYGIDSCCHTAIIAALRKPYNFPILLFSWKYYWRKPFSAAYFCSCRLRVTWADRLAESLGLEMMRQMPTSGLRSCPAGSHLFMPVPTNQYTASVFTLHLQPCGEFQQ